MADQPSTPIFDQLTAFQRRAFDPATERIPVVTQPDEVQTDHPRRKIGRLPENPARPRLKLGTFLRSAYVGNVPEAIDYSRPVTEWPMFLNDQLGDCTAADAAHAVQLWTTWGTGETVTVTDDDVRRFYSGATGYDPADPSTDQGGNMQEVCEYFQKTGMAGRRIEAFFRVDTDDDDELRAALFLFGAISIGMSFPSFAMDQFDQGRPWDVAPGQRVKLEGGHDVLLVGMTKGGNYRVVTWGKVQDVTPRFWARFMGSRGQGEAWARVETDWMSSSGVAPGNALDVDQLNAAFTELTGQPGPFVHAAAPPPAPTPVPPTPAPSPEPVPAGCAAFLSSLRDQIDRFLTGGTQ